MKKDNAYRLNVGLIIVNDSGKVLLCKRKDNHKWQFPQGGINKDETAISAAKREMFEEVGIKFQSTIIIGETEDWYKYEVPKTKIKPHFKKGGIVGQKQKWLMLKLNILSMYLLRIILMMSLMIMPGYHIGIRYLR